MNKLIAATLYLCLAVLALPTRAQTSANPSNTVVRFDVRTEGTNFGTVDIELFDQEKPDTVRNFLLYVNAGVYSNLVIHRAESNFVIQAGHVRVTKPNDTNSFSSYTPGKNFGTISNEYSVGPVRSNVFGTISMARADGQTNSASADWFINLNDNTNLDTQFGGFTVFGQVIDTTGPNTGTNVLNYFRNITNTTFTLTLSPFEFFQQLPFSTYHYYLSTNHVAVTNVVGTNSVVTTNDVTVTNTGPVQVQDLFTIRPSIIQGNHPAPDKVKPRVVVQTPSTRTRVTTNASLTLGGKSLDNAAVDRVVINGAAIVLPADKTRDWSTGLPLTPGTNTFTVTTVDRFGNESAPQRRSIFYQVPTPFGLTNSGPGSVKGATNQQMLDIGRNYTIEAVPLKGNIFAGWQGSASSIARRITFRMREGFGLTAIFSTNYFPALHGTYSGLITPRRGSGQRVAGTITLRLAASGQFTGKLQPITATYPIHGGFGSTQTTYITGNREGNPLTLSLRLATNGAPLMVGFYADANELGDVLLYRLDPPAAAEAVAGHYTLALIPPTNSVVGDGFGIGTADLTASGAVSVSGTLQDGTTFSTTSSLYSSNQWPLLVKRSTREALIGWMFFNTNNSAFAGNVAWVSEKFSTNKIELDFLTSSRFEPTGAGSPLNWTNGTITLSGDDLTAPLNIGVTLDAGAITAGANTVGLQLTPAADGSFTGTFNHPVSGLPAPVHGVFLQSSNMAAGFFQSTNRSGAIRIQP